MYVAWQGVEPERGQYNHTYIAVLKDIVKKLSQRGIYVIADMHQDTLSNKFCGEGVPDWAALHQDPFPYPLPYEFRRDNRSNPIVEDCIKYPFFLYYFTKATAQAFQALYDNKEGIQQRFGEFWELVATHFKHFDNLLGYEFINEPVRWITETLMRVVVRRSL